MGSKGAIVEIGASEVRGMLFSSSFSDTTIERMDAVPVEEGKVSYAVERLISAFPSDAPVTLMLPGHLFIVRKASLPFADRKKIRKALPFQLDGLLPFPVDNLFVDSVLSATTAKGSDVMAVAIPKKTVTDYLNLFPAGRKPSKVIPDFVSLISLGKGVKEELLVIETRDDGASAVLLSGGRPVLMRYILSKGGAEAISAEIASTIKFFQAEDQPTGKIIYLSGPGVQQIAPSLKEAVTIPLPDVIKGMAQNDWPLWAIIAGAAMATNEYSGFNILGLDAESERFEKILKASAIGAAVLLILGTVDTYMHYNTASKRYSSLKAESSRIFMSVMPQTKKVVKEDAQIKDALNRERDLRESLIGKPSPPYLSVVNKIEEIVGKHQEIKIREAVFEGDSVTVSGNGNGIETEGIKKLFSGMEGTKGAHVEEMAQGVEPNSYRFRVKINMDVTGG